MTKDRTGKAAAQAAIKPRYTVDDLMRTTCVEEFVRHNEMRRYYLRTLGAAADDSRRNIAVLASRRLYRKLQDTNSQEYQNFVAELDELDRLALENTVAILKRRDLAREAQDEIVIGDAPELGKDFTATELVETQEAEDQAVDNLRNERQEYAERREGELREDLKTWTDEQLLAEAKKLQIDAMLDAEFGRVFNNATLYHAVYRDERYRQRLFANEDDAGEADPALRDRLITTYFQMDAFTQDVLKNSPSGPQSSNG